MSDASDGLESNGNSTNGNAEKAAQKRSITSNGQFIKDLSFENPNAGKQFQGESPPKIDISISVNGRPAPDSSHEVELNITAKATVNEELLFLVELVYGGTFKISGVTPEQIEPVVMIECPRLLFPFARRIIADCTRDGGYPPLMIEPMDFARMYMQRRSQTAEEKQSPDIKN